MRYPVLSVKLRAATVFVLVLTLAATGRAELRVSAEAVGLCAGTPYVYIRVDVRNGYGREMKYRLVVRDYFSNQQTVVGDQTLAAGQTRVYHLPIIDSPFQSWQLETVDATGRKSLTSCAEEERNFLHVCPLRDWLSPADLQGFSTRHGSSSPSTTGSTSLVSQAEVGNLPDNWLCYTPFATVFMDEPSWKRIAPAEGKALTQWVQAGGRLVVYGTSETAHTVPTMLGAIEYVSENPIQSNPSDPQQYRGLVGWRSNSHPSQTAAAFPFVVQKWTGRLGGLSLATLFFVVAGPLNYWYFSRRGQIRMLLISLPLASIACCLLITGYFLVSQGFARQGGSVAVIMLDEETDSAMTLSRHVFYSGLFPLGGFSFSRDTAFCPADTGNRQDPFTIDLTEDQRVRSGFFSPLTNFHYFTVRPWTTRAKLVWDAEAMTVVNGFDADASHIVLQVGDQYYEARDVPKGGRGALVELKDPVVGSGMLAEQVLQRGREPEQYVLRNMRDFLSVYSQDAAAVRYAMVFVTPPVDVNAGLTMAGGNQFCVLVGKGMSHATGGKPD